MPDVLASEFRNSGSGTNLRTKGELRFAQSTKDVRRTIEHADYRDTVSFNDEDDGIVINTKLSDAQFPLRIRIEYPAPLRKIAKGFDPNRYSFELCGCCLGALKIIRNVVVYRLHICEGSRGDIHLILLQLR